MIHFSVLMPVYQGDSACQFEEALNSVTRQQSLKPTEVVVVVDGPVDWLKQDDVLANYSDFHIRFVAIDRNRGLSNALNVGLDYCRYELVARMDSDDLAMPDRFAIQIPIISMQSDLAVIGGAIEEFDNERTYGKRKCPNDLVKIRKYARLRNPVNHPTVIFRKSHILSVGGYHEFDGFEDYDLWVRLIRLGYHIINIDDVCVKMRINKNFYKRRRGLKYLLNEFRFSLNLFNQQFLTRWGFARFLMLRLLLRVTPPTFVSYIYNKVLRENG